MRCTRILLFYNSSLCYEQNLGCKIVAFGNLGRRTVDVFIVGEQIYVGGVVGESDKSGM